IEEILKKFNLDFGKCSSITTDGAKAMTDLKKGFIGQLKQRNLNIIHCIIHQEALVGKMETITKIINGIKSGHKFLTHRKFKLFLDEHKAVYTDVPLHCPVRWLSVAKMKLIKNERRSILNDDSFSRLMRFATCNMQIDVSDLANKRFQKSE
ncbi:SCND3 protein, partial [Acromyrmex heyeri]